MSPETIVLVLVVITALGFDFTNGFHDTGNAMATSIATGALKPKAAVLLSAVLNLVGAFLSVQVALAVTKDVVKIQDKSGNALPGVAHALILIVLAGLVGGIVWNLLTWLFGLPSSSSHALFGGLIGATIAALGFGGVKWVTDDPSKLGGVVGKVILPAVLSPVVAAIVAALATWVIYRITAAVGDKLSHKSFRWGQIGTASLVSLAHGTGDATKTMGVITLALIATNHQSADDGVPAWVKIVCALSIAAGTYAGGWRVIRTLGKGLVEIESPQGMAAEAASATVILTSSHLGMALSTTHVATGSILGTGIGKKGAEVRWAVAGRMVVAWLITLPAAAVVGAIMYWIGDLLGRPMGPLVVFGILAALAVWMYWRARSKPVTPDNVNDEWSGMPEDVKVPAVVGGEL